MTNDYYYISISEASEKVGISQHFIRQLIKSGKLTYLPSGAKHLIEYNELITCLENLKVSYAG